MPEGELARATRLCPKCSRPVHPGQVFAGAAGLAEDGVCSECGQPLIVAATQTDPATTTVYEEKSVACTPAELDRIARAEAVDGWALHDTTVDEMAADRIVAHFRRRVHAPPPAAAEPAKGGKIPAPAARSRDARRVPDRTEVVESPQHAPEVPAPKGATDMRLAFAVIWLIGLIVLWSQMGTFGFLLGLFVLPGILRGILGLPGEKRDRRR